MAAKPRKQSAALRAAKGRQEPTRQAQVQRRKDREFDAAFDAWQDQVWTTPER